MGKIIIDLISEAVEISGNATVDNIILTIIGVISFAVAFGYVGRIFDAIGLYDSDLMSGAHWTIRVALFLGLTYIVTKVFQFIKWLFSFQWWIYLIAGILIIGIIALVYYIKHRIAKSKAQKLISAEKAQVEVEKQIETTEVPNIADRDSSKYYCPRCHSRLVKRHGPYGDFYACEAYGKTGCKYTRKYL